MTNFKMKIAILPLISSLLIIIGCHNYDERSSGMGNLDSPVVNECTPDLLKQVDNLMVRLNKTIESEAFVNRFGKNAVYFNFNEFELLPEIYKEYQDFLALDPKLFHGDCQIKIPHGQKFSPEVKRLYEKIQWMANRTQFFFRETFYQDRPIQSSIQDDLNYECPVFPDDPKEEKKMSRFFSFGLMIKAKKVFLMKVLLGNNITPIKSFDPNENQSNYKLSKETLDFYCDQFTRVDPFMGCSQFDYRSLNRGGFIFDEVTINREALNALSNVCRKDLIQ